MRIGVFGGTFDPPHIGHLILAAEAMDQLGLDKILWILTADPPHKQEKILSPVSDRLAMVQAAIQGNPAFEVSRVEIDRPGPHYALDTVKILHQHDPDTELIYLIGADSLRDIPTWHKPQELIDQVMGFGVMRRPDIEFDLGSLEALFPGLSAKLAFIDTPLLQISSSQIRKRAAAGRNFRYFVPHEVYQIIEEKQLYQPPKSGEGSMEAGF